MIPGITEAGDKGELSDVDAVPSYICPCEGDKPDDGLCGVPSEEDGWVVRCVGNWSNSKHYYIGRYIEIFRTGMKNKYLEINYIDLFSGPGKCRVRSTREIRDGSPLIAAKCGFSKYFFVDMNPPAIDSLKKRFPEKDKAVFYEDDCNDCASDIRSRISPMSINLLVADQTNVQLKFETVRTLAEGRRIDLIVYFPTLYFNRTIPVVKDEEKIRSINDFFGDDGEGIGLWKGSPGNRNGAVVAYYKERLKTIGYVFDGKVDQEITILNEDKNSEMYRLVFASKHLRGYEFWRKIQAIEHHGQRRLPFV